MTLLLKNAIESIQIGVEDFVKTDEKRHLSAVRNIYAGLLLLYKHMLAEMSPDGSNNVLIKKDILPEKRNGANVQFVGAGNRTVDVQEIQKRFKSLNIYVDWNRFKIFQEIRNDIEHYYSQKSAEAIKKELFSHGFVLINDFITRYISDAPPEILDEYYWKVLLKNNEVFEAARQRCLESLEKVKCPYESFFYVLPYLRCQECNSPLIKPRVDECYSSDMILYCEEWNHEFRLDDIIEAAIHDAYQADNYIAIKDGAEPVTGTCPECLSESYIIEEDVCLKCEATRAYTKCQLCGGNISHEEQHFGGFCSHCDYVMSVQR